jgi:hypothetical protein
VDGGSHGLMSGHLETGTRHSLSAELVDLAFGTL